MSPFSSSLHSNILALLTVKERNIHGKIFGGYLMKEAFELAWIGAVRRETAYASPHFHFISLHFIHQFLKWLRIYFSNIPFNIFAYLIQHFVLYLSYADGILRRRNTRIQIRRWHTIRSSCIRRQCHGVHEYCSVQSGSAHSRAG